MILLDTDILTFVLLDGNARVSKRMRTASEQQMETNQNVHEDDFDVEVELLKNNPEFMALMKNLSQEKAAISLQDLRKELGV